MPVPMVLLHAADLAVVLHPALALWTIAPLPLRSKRGGVGPGQRRRWAETRPAGFALAGFRSGSFREAATDPGVVDGGRFFLVASCEQIGAAEADVVPGIVDGLRLIGAADAS